MSDTGWPKKTEFCLLRYLDHTEKHIQTGTTLTIDRSALFLFVLFHQIIQQILGLTRLADADALYKDNILHTIL